MIDCAVGVGAAGALVMAAAAGVRALLRRAESRGRAQAELEHRIAADRAAHRAEQIDRETQAEVARIEQTQQPVERPTAADARRLLDRWRGRR